MIVSFSSQKYSVYKIPDLLRQNSPFLVKCKKFAKCSICAEEKFVCKMRLEKNYCKRRKLKLTHHCIDERSEELAVRGGISVDSLLE